MRLSKIFLLVLILAALVFGGQYLADFKEYFLSKIASDSENGSLAEENLKLRLENESLKSRIFWQEKKDPVWLGGLEYRPAAIFSTYPFNNQRLLGINLGSRDGIIIKMPVAVIPGVLFGQVTEVFPNYSWVRTVFDPSFKTSVRLGWGGIDALLEGGNQPMATLISKSQPAASGDAVYASSRDFPYGMKIGNLGLVTETQEDIFKKAPIEFSYNASEIQKVYVVINYLPR